jgi:hypothetical protein
MGCASGEPLCERAGSRTRSMQGADAVSVSLLGDCGTDLTLPFRPYEASWLMTFACLGGESAATLETN